MFLIMCYNKNIYFFQLSTQMHMQFKATTTPNTKVKSENKKDKGTAVAKHLN